MTQDQWNKVTTRASAMATAAGIGQGDQRFLLDSIRQLTEPGDEAQLDADNAADAQASKDAEIVQIEKRLAELKR